MRKRMIRFFVLQSVCVAFGAAGALAQLAPSMNPGQGGAFGGSSKERPPNAETVITAMDESTFDNRSGVAEFTGSVTVKDPQFTLTCDRLKAFLNQDRKGLERVQEPLRKQALLDWLEVELSQYFRGRVLHIDAPIADH